MVVSYMDKLVKEAEVRFEEKLEAAKRGESLHITSHYSDRAYSLRSCMVNQPMLERDQHLTGMIEDIEKYSNTDFTAKGDVDRRLMTCVTALLKGLLRETLSGTDLGARKINIEKCWNWYKDKAKMLLDWKLTRNSPDEDPAAASDDRSAEHGADRMGNDSDQLVQGRLRKQNAEGIVAARRPNVNTAVAAYGVMRLDFMEKAADAQEKTGITKKLEKHLETMESGMVARKRLRTDSKPLTTADGEQVLPVEQGTPRDSDTQQDDISRNKVRSRWRPREQDEPVPPPPPPPPPQYPKIVYKREKLGHEKSTGPPSFIHSTKGFAPEPETLVRNERGEMVSETTQQTQELLGVAGDGPNKGRSWSEIQNRWLQNEGPATDAELEPLERAMANTQKRWVAARAKEMEEALAEKEVNDTLTLWAYNHARIEEEMHRRHESSTRASQIGRTHHRHTTQRADSAVPKQALRPKTAAPHAAHDNTSRDIWCDGATGGHSRLADGTVNPSLSAYDHHVPSGHEKTLVEREAELMITTPESGLGTRAVMAKHGIKPVSNMHLTGTSGTMTVLDVAADGNTAVAPSLERQVLMPPRARSAPVGKSEAKPKKKGKGKKGKKSSAISAATAASEEELVNKAALYQWLFPTMTTAEAVPSLRRMKELRTVQKIKDTLARSGVNVPTSAIEQGILTPEYQPFIECIGDLPSRAAGFSRDWDRVPIGGSKAAAKSSTASRPSKKKKESTKKK